MTFLICVSLTFFIEISYAFQMQNEPVSIEKKYDLSTVHGRELASIEKPVSPYKIRDCGEVTHTDGAVLTFCLADFDGTTGGFYDSNKNLMVVETADIYTLIHEITHATTLHFYKQGFTDITSAQTQEKMAYNAENLLKQIEILKEKLEKN
jgi:uncharacterized protein (DUF2164 family)